AEGTLHAADDADRMVGLAALLAEANGTADQPHVKDRLAWLVVYATMCRAAAEAAMLHARKTEDGLLTPSPLYVSALKYYRSEMMAKVLDIVHDMGGSLIVNAPRWRDFDNPELHTALAKALGTEPLTAEERLQLFSYVRDTTADAYGGWSYVTGQLAGGGQHAQRLVAMRQYDLERAKDLARKVLKSAGRAEEGSAAGLV
ncbi:MAG: 4-hydroxyphenylacetate 3-hydroxylase, partial [Dehalococcoidia bacterium]|nr:4-hydroxyphenylacetate 3-hydroxylase [Dehalococcoidia bacterium]